MLPDSWSSVNPIAFFYDTIPLATKPDIVRRPAEFITQNSRLFKTLQWDRDLIITRQCGTCWAVLKKIKKQFCGKILFWDNLAILIL